MFKCRERDFIEAADMGLPPISSLRYHSVAAACLPNLGNAVTIPDAGVSVKSGSETIIGNGARITRQSSVLTDNTYIVDSGGTDSGQPVICETYTSFSQFLAQEVPPHHRCRYVAYDAVKTLIRTIAEGGKQDVERSETWASNCSARGVLNTDRQRTEDGRCHRCGSFQAHFQYKPLLAAALKSLPNAAEQQLLLPQAVFGDVLRSEIEKVNRFSRNQVLTIEKVIRDVLQSLREISAIDRARLKWLQRRADEKRHTVRTPTGHNGAVSSIGSATGSPVAEISEPLSSYDVTAENPVPSSPVIAPKEKVQESKENKESQETDVLKNSDAIDVKSPEEITVKLADEAFFESPVIGDSSFQSPAASQLSELHIRPAPPHPDISASSSLTKLALELSEDAVHVDLVDRANFDYSPSLQQIYIDSVEVLSSLDGASSVSSIETTSNEPDQSPAGSYTEALRIWEECVLAESHYFEWRELTMDRLSTQLEEQAAEIAHLDLFCRANFRGFSRLAALFDRVTGATTLPWTQSNLVREPFANVDLDRLLLGMSVAWSRWRKASSPPRQLEDLNEDVAKTWKPPETFIRNTTKFWVRPEQVIRTKLGILKHMPYLIFGTSDSDLERLLLPTAPSSHAVLDGKDGIPLERMLRIILGKTDQRMEDEPILCNKTEKRKGLHPGTETSSSKAPASTDDSGETSGLLGGLGATATPISVRSPRRLQPTASSGTEIPVTFGTWTTSSGEADSRLSSRHATAAVGGCNTSKETTVSPQKGAAAQNNPVIEESQLVSSIYFDSPTGYSFGRRLLRLEGAELVRFRWYGSNDGAAQKEIFIERKTHHESWSGDASTKERFVLPQYLVHQFMSGRLDMDAYATAVATLGGAESVAKHKRASGILKLGQAVQSLILREKLRPMVRTSYLRAAFQLADNNQVRFSLDTNLCMVDELVDRYEDDDSDREFEDFQNASRRKSIQAVCAKSFVPTHSHSVKVKQWCRVGEEICGKNQVVRFPYAVLEVKLQVAEAPVWVSQLLAEIGAIGVYKFSKFQHGMAFLHGDLVGHLGQPHWIPYFRKRGFGAGLTPARRRSQRNSLPLTASVIADDSEAYAYGQGLTTGVHPRFPWLHRMLEQLGNLFGRSSGHRNLPAATQERYKACPETPESYSSRTVFFSSPEMPPSQPGYAVYSTTAATKRGSCDHGNLRRVPDNVYECCCSYLQNATSAATLKWLKPGTVGSMPMEAAARLAVQMRARNVLKVDPKAFFAAERTLLHYVQKALYLAGLAVALVSFGMGTAQLVGMALAALSAATMCLSYGIFEVRCGVLRRRVTKALEKEPLHSDAGPVILFCLIVLGILGAVIINLYDIGIPSFIPGGRSSFTRQPAPKNVAVALDWLAFDGKVAFIDWHKLIDAWKNSWFSQMIDNFTNLF